MTDKQIIDGVDVSGCEFRFRTYGCDCMSSNRETKVLTESSRCACNPNCYYKQLRRKEQEYEELKEKFQYMKKSRDVALKEYNEEFEYKRQITVEHLEQKKKLLKQLDQLKGENVGVLKQLEFVRTLNNVQEAEIRKLTKTLTEIKEIAEKSCCLQPTSDCEEYKNCKECRRISDDKTVQQILQKISECEVRDDKSNR